MYSDQLKKPFYRWKQQSEVEATFRTNLWTIFSSQLNLLNSLLLLPLRICQFSLLFSAKDLEHKLEMQQSML